MHKTRAGTSGVHQEMFLGYQVGKRGWDGERKGQAVGKRGGGNNTECQGWQGDYLG